MNTTQIGAFLRVALTAFLLAIGTVFVANAQEKVVDVKTSSVTMTDGEVRKVDKDAKKITIKHGEIKNLEMPGMTMVFQVKDPAMLDKVKAGDKVKFIAEQIGGAIVVTDIQTAK